jgi:hypothetical protein
MINIILQQNLNLSKFLYMYGFNHKKTHNLQTFESNNLAFKKFTLLFVIGKVDPILFLEAMMILLYHISLSLVEWKILVLQHNSSFIQ